ncbi:MAG TPA: type I DNA topoisomerase [Candidatus Paceibacterota bacterium]|nr:type I DNA topoisomerase [Candidatus Paceibacterota bacterium]
MSKAKTTKEKINKSLIIVESPTKAKTISQFLGKDFQIESSYGHVRDLPKSKIGIDIEHDFEPQYIVPKKAQKNANALKKLALKAPRVILATDEDREGEAIAWHLAKLMNLDDHYERITFHEITPEAIKKALESPRKIDENLVNAQQARRVLDRLVGYELSPFLWQKIRRGLSAGRVQSVALKLIVDRERERQAFKADEYWSISAIFDKKKELFEAGLSSINNKSLDKFDIKNGKQSEEIKKNIESCERFIISEIKKQETKKSPLPPFTTSTLQQEASKKLRFSARQTMRLAQMLYEGQNLGDGSIGLITYMRTDSLNIAESALSKCREVITEKFGKEFIPESANYYKNKSKGAQEAHEAVRPTHPEILPAEIKDKVEPNVYKLYNLIWQRFVASQMKDAIFDRLAISIGGENGKEKFLFKANGNTLKFKGFLAVYPSQFQEVLLPTLEMNEEIKINEVKPEQHFTQPPARYNEASLIKTLEENGIGRPSTYAPIISVLQDRFYVEKDEERRFFPTELGFIVNDILAKHFSQITDINFTAKIEEDLDEVAEGKEQWKQIIRNFYWPFKENLTKKYDEVVKEDFQEKTDEICEKCGKPMLVKWSKFGKFLGCSGFPECRNIKKLIDASKKVTGVKCPKCKEGDVIIKRTKAKKRMFYGCSRWPDCDFVSWKKPTEESGEEALESEKNEEE